MIIPTDRLFFGDLALKCMSTYLALVNTDVTTDDMDETAFKTFVAFPGHTYF